jgi:hypothetical protein
MFILPAVLGNQHVAASQILTRPNLTLLPTLHKVKASLSGPGAPKGCTLRVFEGRHVVEEK